MWAREVHGGGREGGWAVVLMVLLSPPGHGELFSRQEV